MTAAVVSDALALLAGFALAHAAWSVSDLPKGELLVPLAVVEKNGQRQLLRFEAKTQEQAIAQAKAALTQRQPELDAWAFVREGLLSEGTGTVDVLRRELRPSEWSRSCTRAPCSIRGLDSYGRVGASSDA
jgi:hypothetical protein